MASTVAKTVKADLLPGALSADHVNSSQSSRDEVGTKQQAPYSKKAIKDGTQDSHVEPDKRKSLSNEKERPNYLGKLPEGVIEDKNPAGGHKETAGDSTPSKQFDCSCGRAFETQRGLSLHLSHYPQHKPQRRDTPTKQPDPARSLSEPSSPVHSPGSSPSSPYNLSSFKTSGRNPQYYSIIRTRSSTGTESEGGTKRVRGSGNSGPATKMLQLNSGEKVPVAGEISEDSDRESPYKKRSIEVKKVGKQRIRTRSSNSDPSSPKPEDEVMLGGGANVGGGQKNSPVTRSNSATMKAPEFVSLPSRRRRGGKRGGRGRSSATGGRGQDDSEVDDESIGETSPSPQVKAESGKSAELDQPTKRKRGRPPKNRKDESPVKKAGDGAKGARRSNKSRNEEEEEDEQTWENYDDELKEEATSTDYVTSDNKSKGGKKGGNKDSEKESGKKTRKANQKSSNEADEATPTSESAEADSAPKRTRSKSKSKDAEKDGAETAEGDKEQGEQGTSTGRSVVISSGSRSKGQSPEQGTEESDKQDQEQRRPSTQESLPPVSSPTASYIHPYAYPAPYPHPPPIMYPPGPSGYHPYYGYPPGGPASGGYPVPPPGMMVPPPHPGTPMSELSPHPSAGSFPQHPTTSSTSGSVQVSVLEKPPTQLPTVSLPPSRPPSMYPLEATTPGSPMSPQAMMRPPYMPGMGSPDEMSAHPLSRAYRPGVMGPMPGYPPMHPQAPYHPHPHLAVRLDPAGIPYMEWAPDHKPPPPEEPPARPVECPECGRMFKNNKALNGHMRLHGGFDWTKKPYTTPEYAPKHAPLSMNSKPTNTKNGTTEDKQQPSKKTKPGNKRSRSNSRSPSRSPSSTKSSGSKRRRSSDETKNKKPAKDSSTPLPVPRAPTVFTFDKVDKAAGDQASQSRNATLDDLCRAAELLDSMEGRSETPRKENKSAEGETEEGDSEVDENGRRRPKNITIPPSQSTPMIERDRLRLGATPPYTPPPILSPSRSLTMLATGAGPVPGTPCRILPHWSSRRSSDGHPLSESEESYNEPRINVGREFQADLPPCSESNTTAVQGDPGCVKVWQVIDELTPEDEATIDGYLEIACSPAVLHSGRNKELALHLLYQLGGSVKEAVRCLLASKTVFTSSHPMNGYNYSGAGRWTARERQQFRRAWRVHGKQFHLIRSAVESKRMCDVIEYYYTWKKYCSDEYRGRNRHFSEEILSDEDVGELRSSSSEASGDHDTPLFTQTKKVKREKVSPAPGVHSKPPQGVQEGEPDHFPIVYAPHTSQSTGVHQYKCKYPGCNQIFTSIFALNGHIRVHGGSFYPKPNGAGPSKPILTNPAHHTFAAPRGKSPSNRMVESRSQQQLELAKALLELPQPRSPARGVGYHTPSPKPSPKSRSPGVKKKLSSASPGEREGFYPCNRCGRVFTKVKSRSAHMKSHIVKQN